MDKTKARRYILTGAVALITATGAYAGAVLKTETEKDEVCTQCSMHGVLSASNIHDDRSGKRFAKKLLLRKSNGVYIHWWRCHLF